MVLVMSFSTSVRPTRSRSQHLDLTAEAKATSFFVTFCRPTPMLLAHIRTSGTPPERTKREGLDNEWERSDDIEDPPGPPSALGKRNMFDQHVEACALALVLGVFFFAQPSPPVRVDPLPRLTATDGRFERHPILPAGRPPPPAVLHGPKTPLDHQR